MKSCLSDTCTHRGASLAGGKLTGLVTVPEPGRSDFSSSGEIIRCPWHAWEFDLRTGRSYCDPRRMRLMNFPASVTSGATLAEGPYKADTFPVSIEAAYVVIEMT